MAFQQTRASYIGDVYDRTGELPGGVLEAALYLPKEAWLTTIHCLGTIWHRLSVSGVNGDGRRMTVVDFSFSAGN